MQWVLTRRAMGARRVVVVEPHARLMFSAWVTASRWLGRTHPLLRHRWSSSNPAGTGPTIQTYMSRCTRRGFPPLTLAIA